MDVSSQEKLEVISTKDTSDLDLEYDTPPTYEENTLQDPCEEPQISLHALSNFSTPQTFKLISYIKHHK